MVVTGLPQASELHRRLREATKTLHHATDHHPLLAVLLSNDISLSRYGNALAALHGALAPMESGILEFLEPRPGLFDYAQRVKTPALEQDLAQLGRKPIITGIPMPTPGSIPELIGILYCIEGSTLGGRFIVRHLRQSSGESFPMAYFSVYGELTELRWGEFWKFADSHCRQDDYERSINLAVATFQSMKRHFDSILETGDFQ